MSQQITHVTVRWNVPETPKYHNTTSKIPFDKIAEADRENLTLGKIIKVRWGGKWYENKASVHLIHLASDITPTSSSCSSQKDPLNASGCSLFSPSKSDAAGNSAATAARLEAMMQQILEGQAATLAKIDASNANVVESNEKVCGALVSLRNSVEDLFLQSYNSAHATKDVLELANSVRVTVDNTYLKILRRENIEKAKQQPPMAAVKPPPATIDATTQTIDPLPVNQAPVLEPIPVQAAVAVTPKNPPPPLVPLQAADLPIINNSFSFTQAPAASNGSFQLNRSHQAEFANSVPMVPLQPQIAPGRNLEQLQPQAIIPPSQQQAIIPSPQTETPQDRFMAVYKTAQLSKSQAKAKLLELKFTPSPSDPNFLLLGDDPSLNFSIKEYSNMFMRSTTPQKLLLNLIAATIHDLENYSFAGTKNKQKLPLKENRIFKACVAQTVKQYPDFVVDERVKEGIYFKCRSKNKKLKTAHEALASASPLDLSRGQRSGLTPASTPSSTPSNVPTSPEESQQDEWGDAFDDGMALPVMRAEDLMNAASTSKFGAHEFTQAATTSNFNGATSTNAMHENAVIHQTEQDYFYVKMETNQV